MFLFAEQKQNTFVTVTNFTSKVIKQVFYIYSTSYHRFVSDLWFLCGMIEVRSLLSISVDNAVLLRARTHTRARAHTHTHTLPIVAHTLIS